jgi:L-aspartate oxidase
MMQLDMDDPDYLVIGAGVAGLRAAIELADAGRVLVVAKESLRESSSEYAQGGIAAALADDDEIELHERDTLAAGDGLCDPAAVRTLVEEGPGAVRQLIDWGAAFDRQGSKLAFTREGAHTRSRVLHAHGDSTGQEIARTLYRKASSFRSVEFRGYRAVSELLVDGTGAVCGARLEKAGHGIPTEIRARTVLLATGGLGSLFLNTTNPEVATGDGVAMAWRAGAEIADIEFVQFHPTALHKEGAPRFLLSEALRGEGARLLNARGERFVDELAPRDVVARAIAAEMARSDTDHVLLDLTDRPPGFVSRRFPRIYETCMLHGVDLEKEPAPVAPAAHYAMGGVRTDLDGRTSLARLFAAGEAAATGVHGANRLASNSLLEGVVFGARAGRAMKEVSGFPGAPRLEAQEPEGPGELDAASIRRLMWDRCGIVRSGEGLSEAACALERGRPAADARNMRDTACLIARCALAREESRGAHFRSDFPERRPEFARHSVTARNAGISFR